MSNLLLTMRQSETTYIIPGAKSFTCCDCGELVWVSPATLTSIAGEDVKIVCLQCAPPLKISDLIPPTDNMIKELKENL